MTLSEAKNALNKKVRWKGIECALKEIIFYRDEKSGDLMASAQLMEMERSYIRVKLSEVEQIES